MNETAQHEPGPRPSVKFPIKAETKEKHSAGAQGPRPVPASKGSES
jgi:hypothetical protein